MKKPILIALIANCVVAQHAPSYPEWKATVKVLDESGQPIGNADVSIWYYVTPTNGASEASARTTGKTDANGVFNASGRGNSATFDFVAKKEGYYKTTMGYELGAPYQYDPVKWSPNMTLVLKKIENPIPMYAKWVDSEPSAFKKNGRPPVNFNKSIGYDLIAGDWAAPFGKGIDTNILFTEEFNRQSITDFDYTLTVTFPNGGGIQKFESPALVQDASEGASDLRSPHEAPAGGYQNSLTLENYHHPDGADMPDSGQSRSYFIRITTPTGTLYGKI
ncbi:MAG: carboxypeptidase-like regulatory domain-containing protein, partial [Limisphaerales bacterium]